MLPPEELLAWLPNDWGEELLARLAGPLGGELGGGTDRCTELLAWLAGRFEEELLAWLAG